MQTTTYTPPYLVEKFLTARSPVSAILGPLGSGKSVGSIMKMIYHAKRTLKSPRDGLRHNRWVVIRNTSDQLRDTTIKTFLEWYPSGTLGEYKEYTRTYYVQLGDIRADILFRALDREADARRVLSLDTTGAFLNEWREINESIFNAIRGRCGRYPRKEPLSLTLMGLNEISFDYCKERHNTEIDYLDEKPFFKVPDYITENNYREYMNEDGELLYPDKSSPFYGHTVKISLYDWFGVVADTNPPDETSYIYNFFEKEDHTKKQLNRQCGVRQGKQAFINKAYSAEKYGEVIEIKWAVKELAPSTFDESLSTAPPDEDKTTSILNETLPDNPLPSTEKDPYTEANTHVMPTNIMPSSIPAIFRPQSHVFGANKPQAANTIPFGDLLTRTTNQSLLSMPVDFETFRREMEALSATIAEKQDIIRKQYKAPFKPLSDHEKALKLATATWLLVKQPSGISPFAENIENLPSNYYANLMLGAKKQWSLVHVNAQYGATIEGTPVFEESFDKEFHTRQLLQYNPTIPLIIGMDFGRTPSAIVMQRQSTGHVYVLREFTVQGMGLELFIATILKPGLALYYPHMPVVVSGDPSGAYQQQGPEGTLYDTLETAGFEVVNPGSNKPVDRINAVEYWLKLNIGGQAAFVIDRTHCPHLVRGFERGYYYRAKRTGESVTVPFKNEYSHDADACQYGCMVIHENFSGGTHYIERIMPAPAASGGMMAWT